MEIEPPAQSPAQSPAQPRGSPGPVPMGLADEAAQDHAGLRTVARDLEAAFIAEMLKQSGLGTAPEGFGGGHGEDQFASFLREEHARLFSERGGIGLAEGIFQALVARQVTE